MSVWNITYGANKPKIVERLPKVSRLAADLEEFRLLHVQGHLCGRGRYRTAQDPKQASVCPIAPTPVTSGSRRPFQLMEFDWLVWEPDVRFFSPLDSELEKV